MSYTHFPWLCSALWSLATMLTGSPALAQLASQVAPLESGTDGVYGRFDGDWDLGLGLGAVLSRQTPQGIIRGSAHYFSMAGLYGSYAHRPGSDSDPQHFAGIGLDVRPAFIPRFALDYQTGRSWSDLVLDSISIGLGAFWWSDADGPPKSARGFESTLGMGFPLILEAAGPWLECRAGAQFPDAGESDASIKLLLTWHGFWISPIASAAP